MKFLKISSVVVLVIFLCAACEKTPLENNGTDTEVDVQKSARLVASADSVISKMIQAEDEGAKPDAILNYVEDARDLYKEAADANPANSRANFGSALLSFQQLLENPDMKYIRETLKKWADDVDNLDYSRYYVTQYFMFGKTRFTVKENRRSWDESIDPFSAFLVTMYFVQDSLSKSDLISLLQDIIDTTLIGTLDEAITYIEKVLNDKNFVFSLKPYNIKDDSDIELDLGEAYMIAASMHILRGSLKMITSYQYSIPGLTGNRDIADQTKLISLIKTQDVNGGNFLKLRNTTILPSAKKDLLDALSLVNSGVDYIKSETDDQSNDLIKKEDITRADSDISSAFEPDDKDIPIPLLRGTSGIVSLANSIETMLSGPFDIELESETGTETLKANISAFLNNGITDFKKVLPYHEWVNLDGLQINYDGPGIDTWTWNISGEEIRMIWINLIYYYEDAINDYSVWNSVYYVGQFSKDGILTISGYYTWQNNRVVDLNPDAKLTTDGAFYLDKQRRLCITKEAYDSINTYIKSLPRDSYTIFDLAREPGNFNKNYSLDAPFGIRDNNTGVIKFSGNPPYDFVMDPVYLVDAKGNKLGDDAFPIFPDPTFGGILPGMTQKRLEEIGK